MNYQLIALDMDGTVLGPDTLISAKTAEAINQALDAGIYVVFCSGRCTAEVRPFSNQFPRMQYAVCENGAYVVDLFTEEYVDYRGLERWLSDRIMKEAKSHDVMIQMAAGGKYYMQDWTLDRLSEFGLGEYGKYKELLRETGVFVHDLPEFYRTFEVPVSKVNFYCTSLQDRAKILAALQAEKLPLTYVSGLADDIEMVSQRAGKGVGLSVLCEYLKIAPEQVIAVGDNSNDISMLQAAGLAVAMGNAVPALKEIADEVTEDNAHDGVAAVIRKYLL